MSNVLQNPSLLAKRALMVLENQLTFTKNANTAYSDQFARTGAKIGDTINVRKPPRFIGRDGQALQIEGVTESFVPVTITNQAGCDISLSLVDQTLSLDDVEERILKPMMATVANKIDASGTALYKDINRLVNHGANASTYGVAGVLNGGSQTQSGVASQILTAGAILTENGVVDDGSRAIVVDPMSRVSIASTMTNVFNPQATISGIFEKGQLGKGIFGFEFGEDPNIQQFTPMAAGSLTALSSAPASGATTLAVTTTAGTIPRGTVISIAGVFAINPQSRVSTGRLMQFVVTVDTVVTTTGTLPIYPAYIPSGALATCVGTPGGTAAITTWTGAVAAGPYSQSMAYHKNAFTLATADMELPRGVHIAERVTHNGITMSMISAYDINSNQMPLRFDVLFGWKTIYPELAVRLGG